jgi:hypothetical protein
MKLAFISIAAALFAASCCPGTPSAAKKSTYVAPSK